MFSQNFIFGGPIVNKGHQFRTQKNPGKCIDQGRDQKVIS